MCVVCANLPCTSVVQEYFKVVVVANSTSRGELKLSASAYIASQAELVKDNILRKLARKLGIDEPLDPFGRFESAEEAVVLGKPLDLDVKQVSIAEIELKTGLDFGPDVRDASVIPSGEEIQAAEEGVTFQRKTLRTLEDVVLPSRAMQE